MLRKLSIYLYLVNIYQEKIATYISVVNLLNRSKVEVSGNDIKNI